MKQLLALNTIFLFLLSCNNVSQNRIDYLNYKIADRLNSDWIIKNQDNERNWKYLENKNDSNLVCRCVADTIWDLMIFNISEHQKDSLKQRFDFILNVSHDSIYSPKSAESFEFYELKWVDPKNRDIITLSKTKMNDKAGFGSWTLEITNDSLLNRLNEKHDPLYNLSIPGNE